MMTLLEQSKTREELSAENKELNEKNKKIDKNSLKNKAKEILNFSKNPLKNKDEITKLCNEIKLSDADKSVKEITNKISKSVEKKVASIFTKNINENILNRFYSRIIKEDGEENNETQQLAQDLLNRIDEVYFSGENFEISINKVIQILKAIDSFGDKIQEINKNPDAYILALKAIDSDNNGTIEKQELEKNIAKILNEYKETYNNFNIETFALFICFSNLKKNYSEFFNKSNGYFKDLSFSSGLVNNLHDEEGKKLFKKYFQQVGNNYKPNELISKMNETLSKIPAITSEFGDEFKTFKNAKDYINKLINTENNKPNSNDDGSNNENSKPSNDNDNTENNKPSGNDENSKPDNSSSENNRESADETTEKRKWFIYDVELPTPGNDESLQKFIKFMTSENEDGPIGKFTTIVKELNSYKKKYGKDFLKIDDDTTQTQTESVVGKYINKEKVINEGFLFKSIESYREQLDEINRKYEEKLSDINNKLAHTSKYSKTNKLELKFKLILTDWGSDTSKVIVKFKKAAEPALKKVRNKKFKDSLGKTPEQQGQENLDIKSIREKLLKTNYTNERTEIAKYMLANILNKNNDPNAVIKILSKFNFKDLWPAYVYAGETGSIYALDNKSVSIDKIDENITVYNFDKNKASVFKRPADLLNQIGISINSLKPDVLKTLKKEMHDTGILAKAEEYLKVAEGLLPIIERLSKKGNESVVAEEKGSEYYNDIKKPAQDINSTNPTTAPAPAQNTNQANANANATNPATAPAPAQNANQTRLATADEIIKKLKKLKIINALKKICNDVFIDKKIFKDSLPPTGVSPENIVVRQIFKGFQIINYNEDKQNIYIASGDINIKEKLKELNASNANTTRKAPTPTPTPSPTPTPDYNNIGVVGDGDTETGAYSIVTTANADSTYGDGYGYNKKANAIKKKLNCTTYTYSPNSKMKIVRRTFD